MHARFFTDMGPVRQRNEDAGGVYYNHTGQMLVVICDGMGGHNAGDVASNFVNDLLGARFTEENYIERQNAEGWLKSNISDINRQLYQRSHENNENQGMGTTLVCALMFDHQVVIANVGDSRAYLINEREMRQVTHDHTFVNHLLMAGGLTKEEARNHPQRNVITKVMGSDKRIHPDMFEYDFDRYDYLLLSSDGLTDYLEESYIHDIIKTRENVKAAGEALINASVEAGARDNISVVLVPLKGGE
ncbi:Stp1/IreP family PP2C-type Ser/Thr phosphatase [Macrococcus epidermidis]|uniref:Stp1/IreP family PP2C-type Ser/Thr phosphatase n=1 Tax=Macrococcus epidermidis TaxID=1902580 RepID=UPI001EF28E1D|nr:Stp1/IreP family PP2C-type Ser/Thr phosphatase [Macrococcus epidermidis]MCG7419844.1 Stp1/IreP family PP2C-type Ser/Thr phosphatase [Macrococcus epidermidis]